MQGFTVRLRPDGVFEAPSRYVGRSSVRVLHDPASPCAPWACAALDDEGIKWERLRSFASLDAALDFSVLEAIRDVDLPHYAIALPCGTRFRRPGRVPVEQAMASAGWLYVNAFIGFGMFVTPAEATAFDVRQIALSRVEGTNASVGSVDLSDEDGEGKHWCVDYLLPCDGFLQEEEMQAEARSAFASEGVEVIPHFDFRMRTSVAAKDAAVSPFPIDRIVRRPNAA